MKSVQSLWAYLLELSDEAQMLGSNSIPHVDKVFKHIDEKKKYIQARTSLINNGR